MRIIEDVQGTVLVSWNGRIVFFFVVHPIDLKFSNMLQIGLLMTLERSD